MAGRYYEELEVGTVLKHSLGRTVTETDNVLFSTLTMNPQPLHLNEDFARKTEFGQRIVNGSEKMPPFGHLPDADLKALLDYLKSL